MHPVQMACSSPTKLLLLRSEPRLEGYLNFEHFAQSL